MQKKILEALGLEFQQANRTPKPIDPALATKLKPAELCSLTKAWTELEERKRIIRMKPKPRDVDVGKEAAKAPKRAVFTE